MCMIFTAKQLDSVQRAGGYRNYVRRQVTARWPGASVPIWWDRATGDVTAQIIRTYWAVQCPACPEAMIVQPGEPFFCPNCLNAANQGLPLRVVFPPERAALEAVLLKRPVPQTRNWRPGETVEALRAENAAHGIGE
jgi:hypothetical protein